MNSDFEIEFDIHFDKEESKDEDIESGVSDGSDEEFPWLTVEIFCTILMKEKLPLQSKITIFACVQF